MSDSSFFRTSDERRWNRFDLDASVLDAFERQEAKRERRSLFLEEAYDALRAASLEQEFEDMTPGDQISLWFDNAFQSEVVATSEMLVDELAKVTESLGDLLPLRRAIDLAMAVNRLAWAAQQSGRPIIDRIVDECWL